MEQSTQFYARQNVSMIKD